jgi:nicotinamidase-related amidase
LIESRAKFGGEATDYCVKFTALDAAQFGFKTTLVEDASRVGTTGAVIIVAVTDPAKRELLEKTGYP